MRITRIGPFQIVLAIAIAIALSCLPSCANIGAPEGGPYDVTPPRLIKADPENGMVNQSKNKIHLYFDEAIQILNQNETVIVSPPQLKQPKISSYGRNISITLEDELLDSTTYTIDFTSGLADNNEGNILENFCYAFSTGDELDTMQMSGQVIDAYTMEPVPGVLVGIHSSKSDTAFTKTPFLRTTLTGPDGSFTLKNLPNGRYRVFALKDADRDYAYSQLSEGLAFSDDYYQTEVVKHEHTSKLDSARLDSIEEKLPVDSLSPEIHYDYFPNDIILRYYTSDFKREYLVKKSRLDSVRISLAFNSKQDTIPALRLLDNPIQDDWYVDTRKGETEIIYWLTNPEVYNRDTLLFSVTYPKSDSLNIPRPQTDTLRFAKPKTNKRSSKTEEQLESRMEITLQNTSGIASGTPIDTISLLVDQPLSLIDTTRISVSRYSDSTWRNIPFELKSDTLNPLRFFVKAKWQMGQEYRVKVDSLSWQSVYGQWNSEAVKNFVFLPEEELSSLHLSLSGIADSTAVVELLDKNGSPVAYERSKGGEVQFRYLKPDEYYARLYLDENGNNRWDPGDYPIRQPEWIFYYKQSFRLRKNWQQSEDWVVTKENYLEQKPEPIRTVKPVETEKKNLNEEYEARMAKRNKKSKKKK